MAIHQKLANQQIEALSENIKVIYFCLHYNKSNEQLQTDFTVPCLGYPASILLFSIIDTMGSFFRGSDSVIQVGSEFKKIETASDHFIILNHNILFNLNLSGKTIFDLYGTYRSKLTHNNSLPVNNFLIADSASDKIFSLNSNEEIEVINLIALFKVVESATNIFIHWLRYGQWSEEHRLTQELKEKGKSVSGFLKNYGSDTGNTITNI